MSPLIDSMNKLGDALEGQVTHASRFGILARKMGATIDGMGDLYSDAAKQGLIPVSLAMSMVEYTQTLMELFVDFQETAILQAQDAKNIGDAIKELFGPIPPEDKPL